MPVTLLLATEAGEGAANPGPTIAVVILLAALVAFAAAYYVVGPGKRRGPKMHGDIPLAMRPYHSDAELETTGMERAMAWGVALSMFCAVFLPLYWLIEPSRINEERDNFYEQDVAFGRQQFADFCVECHGENAQGGSASHPDPDVDAPWPAPALNNIMARYEDSEAVPDIEDMMMTTVEQGRPGTPMPAWSSAYDGSMNDQQIEAIVTYLLSIQTGEVEDGSQLGAASGGEASSDAQAFTGRSGEEIFDQHCARCHRQNAQGYTGPSLTGVFARLGGDGEVGSEATEDAERAIRYTINNGRSVPGVGMMPHFDEVLSEAEIGEVIAHLRSIQTGEGLDYGSLGRDPTLPDEDGDDGEQDDE